MSAEFIYFISGRAGITNEQIAQAGLADRIGKHETAVIGKGPSGERGVLLVNTEHIAGYTRSHPFTYDKNAQEWFDCKDYWVGYYRDNKPTPDSLERREKIRGVLVKLYDGNEWLVPIARSFETGMTTMPVVFTLGPNGEPVSEILQEFKEFSADVEKLFEWNITLNSKGPEGIKEREDLQDIDFFALACRALTINYRVSPVEVCLLKLITSQNLWDIFNVLLDWASLEEFVKKKEEETKKKLESEGVVDQDSIVDTSNIGGGETE